MGNIIRQKRLFSCQSGYNSSMSPIYTRAGDDGTTGLLGESRLPKYHPRMETLGVLDEASAALGLARALSKVPQTGNLLKDIQRDLYTIMAEVAATPENARQFQIMAPRRVQWLESQVDAIVGRGSHPDRIHPARRFPGRRSAGPGTDGCPAGRKAGGRTAGYRRN